MPAWLDRAGGVLSEGYQSRAVGYEDFTARTDLGHTPAVTEALLGQISPRFRDPAA